jgi:predicted nucleic acid-binding protein
LRYLLDTNVLKEIGKPSPHQNVAAWFDTVDDPDLAISVISVREIWKGIEKKRRRDQIVAARIEAAALRLSPPFRGASFLSTKPWRSDGERCWGNVKRMPTTPDWLPPPRCTA